MATVIDVLVRAKSLIEAGWTQGSYSRTKGISCSCLDNEADCFCILGAVLRATHELRVNPYPIQQLLQKILGMAIPDFNDSPKTKKSDVLALFDNAIAIEKE